MVDFWSVVIQQVPSLAVLAYIVWAVIRYLEGRDKRDEKARKDFLTALKDQEHHHIEVLKLIANGDAEEGG